MLINQKDKFETIAHRVLFGLKFMFSDFSPTESGQASAQSQQKLHGLFRQLINILYEKPEILKLPDHGDEAYQAWELNNMKPELDKVYQSIFKSLYEFYKFLYISSLHGELSDDILTISSSTLKENKSGYKAQYKALLNEIHIDTSKEKTAVVFRAENDVLQSMKLLAESVPTNVDKWTPYALVNFACCSFTGDFDGLIPRVDKAAGAGGLFLELQKQCAKRGYEQSVECSMTATGYGVTIHFSNKIGGFSLVYSPRKYQPLFFGTQNGIGEKAMLEGFDRLDPDLQKHFISICRPCSNCLDCTKGGKNKKFAVEINYDGKAQALCPSFPRHSWENIDRELIRVLFKYHDAQEKYGVQRRTSYGV